MKRLFFTVIFFFCTFTFICIRFNFPNISAFKRYVLMDLFLFTSEDAILFKEIDSGYNMGHYKRWDLVQTTLEPHLQDISRKRSQLLQNNVSTTTWVRPQSKGPLIVADFIMDLNYFKIISKSKNIHTFFVKASWNKIKDIFPKNEYKPVFSDCKYLINDLSEHGSKPLKRFFSKNDTCTEDLNHLFTKNRMNDNYLLEAEPQNEHLAGYFINAYKQRYPIKDDELPILYINIIENGYVKQTGEIYTGSTKLTGVRCYTDHSTKPASKRELAAATFYNEVFTLSLHFGAGYFHFVIENLSRLMPYLSFFKQHPEIKLHLADRKGFMFDFIKFLGIDPSRIVVGNVKAKVIYQPGGAICATLHSFNAQLMHLHYTMHLYRKDMKRNTDKKGNSTIKVNLYNSTRKYVLLIVRHKKRWFNNNADIVKSLATVSSKYGYAFETFDDQKLPSFDRTIELFYNADVIVAPHGAGLSNMVFSRPGTLIVESMCAQTAGPVTNLCYKHVSQATGHRYYGQYNKNNCFETKPEDISGVVEMYLKSKMDKVGNITIF